MKKLISLIVSLVSIVLCTSCEAKTQPIEMQPQTSQMKSICELATLECYYHTVAKYYEKDAEGFIWKKDRKFWVEYSGIVTVGIDTSLLKMEIKDNLVTITIPEAEIQACKVDERSLSQESFIVDKNSAAVLAEHQQAAYKDAQQKLEEAARNDITLLTNAKIRAKELLENYVKCIGDLMGKEYIVTFIDIGETILQNQEETETATLN